MCLCVCVFAKDLEYECVLVIEGRTVVVDAYVENDGSDPEVFDITCQLHKVNMSTTAVVKEVQRS